MTEFARLTRQSFCESAEMQHTAEMLAGVVMAGAATGTALLPMKFASGWKFENTWLLFSILAYLLSPWLVALATVSQLIEVYSDAGTQACVLTAIFGFGWGLAVVLNGIGVAMIGLSLASAILMGSSIALGSLLPLVFKNPHQVATRQGIAIAALDFVMLIGVVLCAQAGRLRAREGIVETDGSAVASRGILICLAAGVLSTLLNVALTYGELISREAVAHGASSVSAANAIWSLTVSAGSLPSIFWCLSRLSREKGWSLFRNNLNRNAGLCALMAFLFISGTVAYGAAASALGSFGTAIGWPVYMSGIILISNFWGWVTGEWRGISGTPVRYMLGGVGVQIATILLLSGIR